MGGKGEALRGEGLFTQGRRARPALSFSICELRRFTGRPHGSEAERGVEEDSKTSPYPGATSDACG